MIWSGEFADSQLSETVEREICDSISKAVWPPGGTDFRIQPKRKGNGAKPIKTACVENLRDKYGWELEKRVSIGTGMGAGPIDAVRATPWGPFALEWETGNISSSHRALNKIAVGLIQGRLAGGALILPTRKLYVYLTDRLGNYTELEPYFPLWAHVIANGSLWVFAIEHDAEDNSVPLIPKGTDGRALR